MRPKATPPKLKVRTYDQAALEIADGFEGTVILVQGAMSRDGESQVETDLILDETDSDSLVTVNFDKPIPAPAGRTHGIRLSPESALKIANACRKSDTVMLVGTDHDPRTAGIAAGLQRAGLATPETDPYDMGVMPDRTAHDAICLVSGLRARLDAAKNASQDFERARTNLEKNDRSQTPQDMADLERRRERIRQMTGHRAPEWQPRAGNEPDASEHALT